MSTQPTTAMTPEDIIDKYADVDLHFDYYHKYTFYYSGAAEDGTIISACFGGCHYDILGAEFLPVESLADLMNEGTDVYDLRARKPDTD